MMNGLMNIEIGGILMVRKKVGTITLAVGLIATGALLFAQNFTELPIKDLYKYWPLLLVGLGLEIIIYMAFYRNDRENVRISIDGLCVIFIIFAAIFSSSFGAYKYLNVKGIGDIPFIKDLSFANQMEEKVTKTDISKNFDIKELKIINSFGDIKIKSGNSNSISFDAEVRVRYNNEIKVKDYIKGAIQVVEGEITEIYIKDSPQYRDKDHSNAMVNFTIYIPKGITIDAKNSFGDIDVEEAGGIRIKNNNGDIIVRDCSEDVNIKASFGEIQVEKITGNVDAINSNGNIKINEVSGNVDAKTSFGNVVVDGVKGDLKVVSSNGNLEIYESKGNIEGKTSFGNIILDEESIENGRISAETSFGNIRGFDSIKVKESGQKETLEGTLGDANREIILKTSNGNIEVR